jgi:uroporphyrinogen-III synthase
MHILVTRPQPDATTLQSALLVLGHTVMVEPMLEIEFYDLSHISSMGVQGLIATSRNGLRAIAGHPRINQLVTLPLFVVGSGTAEEAAGLGFETIMTGAGTAQSLPELIARQADPGAGRFLYLAGEHLAADLAGHLSRCGFQIETHVAYASRQASALSNELVAAIAEEILQAVMLMSPRTAMTFVDLVLAQNLAQKARKLQYFCLSPAVARALERLTAGAGDLVVLTAAKPTTEELLALLRP